MGRMTAWGDEFFFWTGDRLVRVEKRGPRRYRSGLFLASWVSITLVAHYLGLFAGATHHFYSWAGAAAVGCLLSLVFVIFR